ncbi:MAG: AI-2E family transporter, partial [Planctomycetota bacterium]
QPVRDALVIALIAGVVWLGYALRVVTAPLLLALALAYLVEPVVVRLTRVRWVSREAAAAGLIAAATLVVAGPVAIGAGVGLVQGASFAIDFARNADLLRQSVDNPDDAALREQLPGESWKSLRDYLVRQLAASPEADEQTESATTQAPLQAVFLKWLIAKLEANADVIGRRVLSGGVSAVEAVARAAARAGSLAFSAFLTAFFFFFICTRYARVLAFLRDLLPDSARDEVLQLVGRMDRVVAAFVRGRLTIAAIQAVVFTAGYTLIGVPASLILGPVVAALSIVPYLALVGVPVSVILLWLEPNAAPFMDSWWWTLAAPVAVYTLGQALDDYVLTPLIQGKGTGMDTPTILFASIAGGVLAGMYGLLLAIPVAACLKVLLTDVVWPRVQAWKEGRAPDPLPFGQRRRPSD